MRDLDLFAISDREFEELCCEILAVKFKADVKHGKPGKDSGIDGVFRISSERIVVQANQYAADGYSSLKSVLKKSEVFKAKQKVAADRYILMTSCELSANNRHEILDLYNGIIRDEIDIWSGEDIRSELAKPMYQWVRHRHYNLWLKGMYALDEFLGNGVGARSEELLVKIGEDLAHSIRISVYEYVYKRLSEEKVLVITGQAGTGKTTLAKQLIVDSVFRDEYTLVASDSDLAVCDRELSMNRKRKTLFFIDDFLGANCLEALTGGKDTRIVGLMWRIKRRSNCRLILTSRTNIMQEALDRYRGFDNSGLGNIAFQLDDTKLSRVDKARILYNQMFFGDVPSYEKDCVYEDENYFKIIDHNNFNPRIISYCFSSSFATSAIRVGSRKGIERIKWMLDNPSEIWRDCIEHLNIDEFNILMLVFLVGEADVSKLESARDRLLQRAEMRHFAGVSFSEVMRKLCTSVLTSCISQRVTIFKLFNPSVGDYLIANHPKDGQYIADMLLLYEDVKIAVSLWRGYFWRWGDASHYDEARRSAGQILLEELANAPLRFDVNFVLGNFKELVDMGANASDILIRLARSIASAGLVFKVGADPTLVAHYFHWAFDNLPMALDDERITNAYLDALADAICASKPLVMLNRLYERFKFVRPDDYYERIMEYSDEWADEIASEKSWDENDSADDIWQSVMDEVWYFLEKCNIRDDCINVDECCSNFDADDYVQNGAIESDCEVWGSNMSLKRNEENAIIRRMFTR